MGSLLFLDGWILTRSLFILMNSIGMGRKRSRWESAAAVLASLLIHIFFLLGLAYFIVSSAERLQGPPVLEEPLQLTILPIPSAAKTTPKFAQTQPQENINRKPNKAAAFESDNDSIAASEAAPSGPDAMPSVDGREEKALDLTDQQYTAGKTQ